MAEEITEQLDVGTTEIDSTINTIQDTVTEQEAQVVLSELVKLYDVGTNEEKQNIAELYSINNFVVLGKYDESNKTTTTSAMNLCDGVLIKSTIEIKDSSGNTTFVSEGLCFVPQASIYYKTYKNTIIYQIVRGV